MYLHKFVLIEAQSHSPVRQRNNIEILCLFILNRSTNKGLILQEYMKMGVNRPINNLARVRDLRFACSIHLWEILIFLCFILEISQKLELLFYSLLPFISLLHFSMKIVFRDNLLLQKIAIFLHIFM